MDILVLGLSRGVLYGLLAVGIVLVWKATHVLNFAQAEFGTFAAYLAFFLIMQVKLPWLLGALISVLALGVIGFGFERLVIRNMLDGPKLAMAVVTLGLLTLLGWTELRIWGGSPKVLRPLFSGRGPELFGINIAPTRILATVVSALLGLGLWWFLRKTTFGLGLLASAHDPEAVRLMGIKLRHLSSFTWVASAMLGALAGILSLTALGNFFPVALTALLFVPSLAAALLGGLTSIPGSFAGGIAIGILQALLRNGLGNVPGVEQAGAFVVLLAILIFRPQGLFGKAA